MKTSASRALSGRVRTEELEQKRLNRKLNRKETDIETLIAPLVALENCTVWGVEYLSGGKHSKLCVYIEREGGVDVADCERVSRRVSDALDVEEILTGRYTLEVSSPGMDRILFKPEQFEASVGETIEVRLNYPFDGRKRIVGVLAAVEDDEAVVQVEQEEFLLPLENVQRARLVPQFD